LTTSITGEGLEELLQVIEQRLAAASLVFEIELGPEQGQELSWLYSRGEILSRWDDSESGLVRLRIRFNPAVAPVAQAKFGERLKTVGDVLRPAAE
jgi:GTP-binding protein HflX